MVEHWDQIFIFFKEPDLWKIKESDFYFKIWNWEPIFGGWKIFKWDGIIENRISKKILIVYCENEEPVLFGK